jgi:outer membrane protein TolC
LISASLLSAQGAEGQTGLAPTEFDSRLDAELGVKGGLTAQDVARRALETSFDVRARSAELEAAAADADRARLAYLPDLTVAASYSRLSDPGDVSLGSVVVAPGQPTGAVATGAQLFNVPLTLHTLLNQYLIEANVFVPVSDYFLRIAPARHAAAQLVLAATSNVSTARSRVATDARIAFYRWVRAKLSIAVAEQALRNAEAHLADARTAVGVGSATNADVLRVESQVARSEQDLVDARSLESLTAEQLRTAIHEEPSAPLAIGEDIRTALSTDSSGPKAIRFRELLEEAGRNRPELTALRANAAAFAETARAERAGYLPRFELFASAIYANPNPRTFPPEDEFRGSWQTGGRLSWALSDIPAARDRADAASARGEAVSEEHALLLDRIRVEVLGALQAVDDSAVALLTTRRSLVASEESYRVRRLQFQRGRATSVELLDAETELTRARLETLNAQVETRVARARLNYAIGRAAPEEQRVLSAEGK